jgi:hypothetical protein
VAKKYCPTEGDQVILPTVVIISKEGKIVYIKSGYRNGDVNEIEKAVAGLSD